MKIELVSEGIPELLPMVRTGDPTHHISMIVRYLCIKLGHFEATGDGPEITRMEMGSAFEEAVVEGLRRRYEQSDPHRYIHTGELSLEGLIGTPDLADVLEEAINEIKLTWISARHGDDPECEKFWKYWVQLMAYCHMIGWRLGYLRVGFINGDYRTRVPVYRVWRAEFTQRELDENWRMLKSNGVVMRQAIAAGTYKV